MASVHQERGTYLGPTRTGARCEERPARCVDLDFLTTRGSGRDQNQDAVLVWRGGAGVVAAVVSDGMGGHAHGRRAAEIVVGSCVETVRERDAVPWQETLRQAIVGAHSRVLAAGQGETMGATVVLAVFDLRESPPQFHLAHVGDSRAYLCRGAAIDRLTTDHSLMSRLVQDGFLTEQEAFGHPDGNVIERAIGQAKPLEPEIHEPVAIEEGDWLVLCTDGLHAAVPDREILRAIRRSGSSTDACRALLRAANDAGSQDDVTVLCIHAPGPRRRRRPTRRERPPVGDLE